MVVSRELYDHERLGNKHKWGVTIEKSWQEYQQILIENPRAPTAIILTYPLGTDSPHYRPTLSYVTETEKLTYFIQKKYSAEAGNFDLVKIAINKDGILRLRSEKKLLSTLF